MPGRANPSRPGTGTVIEAQLDRGRGPVATVLVQNGTLKKGDYLVCGVQYGRVRALFDEDGKQTEAAGPSIPVQVLGLPPADDLQSGRELRLPLGLHLAHRRHHVPVQRLADRARPGLADLGQEPQIFRHAKAAKHFLRKEAADPAGRSGLCGFVPGRFRHGVIIRTCPQLEKVNRFSLRCRPQSGSRRYTAPMTLTDPSEAIAANLHRVREAIAAAAAAAVETRA